MESKRAGFIYLVVTILFFSTYEAVSKSLVGRVDAFQINFIRFLLGGILLFVFACFSGGVVISGRDFARVAFLGFLNVVVSMNLIQLSLYVENARAAVVAVIFSSNPIFVTLIAAMIDKEKLASYKLTGLIIGLAGIITVFFDKLQGGMDFRSPALALASAIVFSLYTVLGRRVSSRIGSLRMNAYAFLSGSLLLLPLLLVLRLPVVRFDFSAWPQIAYLAFLVTGVAYLAYFKGLSIIGAGKGSLVFFAKPVIASLIAILFLREKATPTLWGGSALILAGILVVVGWPGIKAKYLLPMQEFPER